MENPHGLSKVRGSLLGKAHMKDWMDHGWSNGWTMDGWSNGRLCRQDTRWTVGASGVSLWGEPLNCQKVEAGRLSRSPAGTVGRYDRVHEAWIGLNWIGLDWTGLDWMGLDGTGWDWIGLDFTGLD